MKSIYASKLYIASSRKDRIDAALIAPSNLELVQQLANDLDEEYITHENLGLEPESEEGDNEPELDEFIVDEEIDPESDLMTMEDVATPKEHSAPSHSSKSDKPAEHKESSKEGDPDLMPESPANDLNNEEPTAASTETDETKESVVAASLADLNILKNTLNGRTDTAGVTRIAEKENEIWIYYNDDINLNNIMTDVIEYIMSAGYDVLEFNRLARSDNAIVFLNNVATADTSDKED